MTHSFEFPSVVGVRGSRRVAADFGVARAVVAGPGRAEDFLVADRGEGTKARNGRAVAQGPVEPVFAADLERILIERAETQPNVGLSFDCVVEARLREIELGERVVGL